MNYRGIIKFKIGLAVIGFFTVAMLILVLTQASATKQDVQTDKLANSMADSLNSYTDSNFTIPASLGAAGIKKTSPYITYTKLSDSKYKFCVNYKTTSSDFDPSATVDNVLAGGVSSWDSSNSDPGYNTDLYLPTSHHKGVNCQTVDIGSNISGGFGCDDSLTVNGVSEGIECPLDSSGGTGSGDGSLGSSALSDDSQRQADIDALDAHLEAYYAANGYYPTFNELNSSSWRTANMQGLDASAICDPSAGSTSSCDLVLSPAAGVYSYQSTDAGGKLCTVSQTCTSFVLTATLSTGKQFTKQSNV